MSDYEDVDYTVDGAVGGDHDQPAGAVQRVPRPYGRRADPRRSARRGPTTRCRSCILTGAGDKAFCTGGDVKQRAETGDYGPTESGMFEIGYLHRLIRDIPKPVIAAVNGLAVGGGHVLQVLCDLSIASETRPLRPGRARGSARSTRGSGPPIWHGSSARSGRGRSGTCAACTTPRPPSAGAWSTPSSRPTDCWPRRRGGRRRSRRRAPPLSRFLKQSFNADTDHQAGLSNLAMSALDLYAVSPEGMEGATAFAEKRRPDFAAHVVHH